MGKFKLNLETKMLPHPKNQNKNKKCLYLP